MQWLRANGCPWDKARLLSREVHSTISLHLLHVVWKAELLHARRASVCASSGSTSLRVVCAGTTHARAPPGRNDPPEYHEVTPGIRKWVESGAGDIPLVDERTAIYAGPSQPCIGRKTTPGAWDWQCYDWDITELISLSNGSSSDEELDSGNE